MSARVLQSRRDKEGKYKYIIRKIGELHRDVKAVQLTLRYITKGLEHEFLFDKGYVEDVGCQDEIDHAILEELRAAGVDGLLPRDLAKQIGSRKVWIMQPMICSAKGFFFIKPERSLPASE